VASAAWEEQFVAPAHWPKILEASAYPWLERAHHAHLWGSASTQWRHTRRDGQLHTLNIELFSNSYSLLVLIWAPQRERLKRRRVLAVASAA
jgi:hypothetical protein